MDKFRVKLITFATIILIFFTLLSFWLYPMASPALSIISLLSNLSISIYAIFKTYKGIEHAHAKILKEIGVMVFTLVIILFLSGIAAMLENAQVGMRWGEVAGLISAIAASFVVGYLVRKGMGRFAG